MARSDVNATWTSYDRRNMAVQVVEEGRQLSATATAELVTTRSYTAFGEVAGETNALGATLTYGYNTMGRLVKTESPYVAITLENGAQQSVRPTDYHYYDLGGRLTGSRDANGNLSRRTLLAGTGYNGGEALVVTSIAADGGTVTTGFDVHGDARRVTDQIGRTTTQEFDAGGRLTRAVRPIGLIEDYAYDGLGQRLRAWNNVYRTPVLGRGVEVWVPDYGYSQPEPRPTIDMMPVEPGDGGHWETVYPIIGYTPDKQLTEYDASGHVVFTRAFGGEVTTDSYAWTDGVTVAGRQLGGWTQTTGYANGLTGVETSDLYGRTTAKTDLGQHVWSYAYDVAGRLTSMVTGTAFTGYVYLNTGLLGMQSVGPADPRPNTNWSRWIATYGYDKAGRRVSEPCARRCRILHTMCQLNGGAENAGNERIPSSAPALKYWSAARAGRS